MRAIASMTFTVVPLGPWDYRRADERPASGRGGDDAPGAGRDARRRPPHVRARHHEVLMPRPGRAEVTTDVLIPDERPRGQGPAPRDRVWPIDEAAGVEKIGLVLDDALGRLDRLPAGQADQRTRRLGRSPGQRLFGHPPEAPELAP